MFTTIYRNGSLYDYYRGNGANVVKIAPETALKFVLFDKLKQRFSEDPHNPTVTERFVSGGCAGALAGAAIYPLEIAKTRLALAPPKKYNGISHCLRKVVMQEGFSALYKGLAPSTCGILPYAAIDLGINSVLKDYYAEVYETMGQEPSVPLMLTCGMISSTSAMMVTYPLNLIRTKLQMSGLDQVFTERVKKPGDRYTSLPQFGRGAGAVGIAKEIYASRGIRGLYRGISGNLLKVVPATSISYTVYGWLDARFSLARTRSSRGGEER